MKLINQKTETVSSLEVAEMLEIPHAKLIRKLEGDKTHVGIIPVLTQTQLGVSDYFISSTYLDTSGKENKCYLISRLGCDFLANKFTGEKGIVFTARYVKRFHEMEQIILSNEDLKASLLLAIYNGGQDGIHASKELVKLEVEFATTPLLAKIKDDKPYTEFAKHVTESSDTIDVGEFAKLVKKENIKIGRNRLFEWFRNKGYLMQNNTPYQKCIESGYFKVIEVTKNTAYGISVYTKTLITGKGQVYFVEKLRKEFGETHE